MWGRWGHRWSVVCVCVYLCRCVCGAAGVTAGLLCVCVYLCRCVCGAAGVSAGLLCADGGSADGL